jgi:glycosyltransferase involved in cell wall biosynthesis
MASGVPCVTTDVGDASVLIGDHGRVVPPRDHVALAEAIHQWLKMPEPVRESHRRGARQRIVERFALQRVAAKYEELYDRLATGRPA